MHILISFNNSNSILATVDAANVLRTFKLDDLESLSQEIITASCENPIENSDNLPPNSPSVTSKSSFMSLQHYSPKQREHF